MVYNKEEKSTNLSQDIDKKNEVISTPKNESKFYDDDSIVDRPRPPKDKFSMLSMQLNLPTPQRKGFVRQWVIDKEKRFFEARDWLPVKGEDGDVMRKVMNHRTKEPEYGTYMEIPEKYFQENKRADDVQIRELTERQVKNKDIVHKTAEGSQSGESTVDNSKLYTPTVFGENKIERNNN